MMSLEIKELKEKSKKVTHKKITPRLKVETIEILKQMAKETGVSMNQVLEHLINEKVS